MIKWHEACRAVAQLCPTLATPWTAAHQASLSFAASQIALIIILIVDDAIEPSHPLSPSSPFVLNLSQHQDLSQ